MNRHSEKTTMVPAAAGFYLVSPVLDDGGLTDDVYFEPVVAWERGPDGIVMPVVFGRDEPLLAHEDNIEVLCPNGRVVSLGRNYDSLDDWLTDQQRRAGQLAD